MARRDRVTAEQRKELLRLLSLGLEFRSACGRAKVSVAAVQADPTLYTDALESFRLGNARLRERAVELTFDAKNASAGSRAALLDRILNRRDAELARLEAAVPQSEASSTKSTDDFLEQIAQVFERMLQNDPLKMLPRYIEAAFSTGKLSAEAAARRLVEVLEGHAPLPYSPEWWAAEKAAGRNGYCVVAAPAKPAGPRSRSSRPRSWRCSTRRNSCHRHGPLWCGSGCCRLRLRRWRGGTARTGRTAHGAVGEPQQECG